MAVNPDSTTQHKTQEHFDHLADIAAALLADELDKIIDTEISDRYEIPEEGGTIRAFTHRQVIRTLESNFDAACEKYSAWELFLCLAVHVSAEYPDFKSPQEFIKNKPLEFIEIMRTLANRKTFQGICPACNELSPLEESDTGGR